MLYFCHVIYCVRIFYAIMIVKGKANMKKTFLKTGCLILAASMMLGNFSGCSLKNNSKDTIPELSGIKIEKGILEDSITSDGYVESTEEDSVITTELMGCKVNKVYFQVGDKLNVGDVVCELDGSELENEIAELEKSMTDSSTISDYEYKNLVKALENTKSSGNLQIESAQRVLDDARNSLNDLNNRYQQKVDEYNSCISQANECMEQAKTCEDEALREGLLVQYKEFKENAALAMEAYEETDSSRKIKESEIKEYENDLSKTKLDVQNEIRNAQYSVDTYSFSSKSNSDIQKDLDEKRALLAKTIVKAEKSGIISEVNIEEGNICNNGLLMTVQSDSKVHVRISIKEENLLRIEKGMRASLTILANPKQNYGGQVEKVNPIKNNLGFSGYVSIDDPSDFKVGMKAGVKIFTVDKKDVISVKNTAVFENDNNEKCVYEVVDQGDGTFTAREVKITEVLKTRNFTEISEDDLEENTVILSNSRLYKDGMIFRVNVEKYDSSDESDSGTGIY